MISLANSILDMHFPSAQEVVDKEMQIMKKQKVVRSWTFDGETIKIKANDNIHLHGELLSTASLHLDFSGRSQGINFIDLDHKPCVGGENCWKKCTVGDRFMLCGCPELRDIELVFNSKLQGNLSVWDSPTPTKFKNVKLYAPILSWSYDPETLDMSGITGYVGAIRLHVDNSQFLDKIFPDLGPRNERLQFAYSPDWNSEMPGDVYPHANFTKMFNIKCKVDVISISWYSEKRYITFVHKSAWKGPKWLMKDSFITEDGYVFVNENFSNLKDLKDPEWYNRHGHKWIHRPKQI